MISILLAAAAASQMPPVEVAYEQLASGQDAAAIQLLHAQSGAADDPARLINLGIAYARQGDVVQARAMLEAAYRAPQRVELETSAGEWVDSRVLARQALALLDAGRFARGSALARN